MPAVLAFINIKFLTPMVSIMFMSVATLICLNISDIYLLINMATLAEYLFITLAVVGLLYLRKSRPDLPRPIKVIVYFL
jgi:amino acid transporter